jgi:hypothetical protein
MMSEQNNHLKSSNFGMIEDPTKSLYSRLKLGVTGPLKRENITHHHQIMRIEKCCNVVDNVFEVEIIHENRDEACLLEIKRRNSFSFFLRVEQLN